MDVHPRPGNARNRLRHKGGEQAVSLRNRFHGKARCHHCICHLQRTERREVKLVLTPTHFVVTRLNQDTDRF